MSAAFTAGARLLRVTTGTPFATATAAIQRSLPPIMAPFCRK